MAKDEKIELISALEKVQKLFTREVVNAIKIGDFTNSRKYTTTCKHLKIDADFLGK